MPLADQQLIIEPTYPNAKELAAIGLAASAVADETSGAKLRNRFWSWRWRSEILIGEEDGKIIWGKAPGAHHLGYDLSTLGCSDAWGIEQEANAVKLLGTLVKHRQFKQYMLTGMFMETSKRSGVSYLFRRLKPTIAITTRARGRSLRFEEEPDHTRILCALCLHPIGYYAGTWAGAMCPTDDLCAHLMLMRGDEKMFWRRCNQIPPYLPNAGL